MDESVVLPVGGIKDKVLAAHRAGTKRIILPERNKKDLVDVPEQAKKEMEFIFATRMDEVLNAALESSPFKGTSGAAPDGGGSPKEGEIKPPEVPATPPEIRA